MNTKYKTQLLLSKNFYKESACLNKKSYLITKRLMDIAGAVFGLIFLAPLFIVIAILIKIDTSKGTNSYR